MLYQSTRGSSEKITAAAAITQGLSENGGLFVPESFPKLSKQAISNLVSKPYKDRAAYIISQFLDDFSPEEIASYSAEAYSEPGFDSPAIAPLHKLDSTTHFLELWHGPTCAFKDMALQMLPRLLTASLRKTNENREVCVLVATSGDTGKAALEGFRDIPGTRIMVFYPSEGVSDVQKLQMTTQNGGNVNVVAVKGNFDDAQTGVKVIFSDEKLRNELNEAGFFLSSANSINWGRLVPQIAYYVSAYCDLAATGDIEIGDKINFCVPTGNFGNILAGYYSERMGLPIGKLVCASNRNDVLTQFINTGVYDKNRQFFTTTSPSMDILVSSNLERFLFEISGNNGRVVTEYMSALSVDGKYNVSKPMKDEIDRILAGGMCTEEETMQTIKEVFIKENYLMDTHTAVAYKVLNSYRAKSGDSTPTVVVSTASAFKFCDSVLDALGKVHKHDGAELLDELSSVTGNPVPLPLSNLKDRTPRFSEVVAVENMKSAVQRFLET